MSRMLRRLRMRLKAQYLVGIRISQRRSTRMLWRPLRQQSVIFANYIRGRQGIPLNLIYDEILPE